MNYLTNDYIQKLEKVIDSCQTKTQLKGAIKAVTNWEKAAQTVHGEQSPEIASYKGYFYSRIQTKKEGLK
jgi:hypothetical protein